MATLIDLQAAASLQSYGIAAISSPKLCQKSMCGRILSVQFPAEIDIGIQNRIIRVRVTAFQSIKGEAYHIVVPAVPQCDVTV